MSTDPQTATPLPPAGQLGVPPSAVVVLSWNPDHGWQLHTEPRKDPDDPIEIDSNSLRYELAATQLLTIREADADSLLSSLGSDATQLMSRVSDGWTLRWNGKRFVGHFEKDARLAAAELSKRAMRTEFPVFESWTADFWLDGADGDPNETTAGYEIMLAESDGVRILGGLPAMDRALRERVSAPAVTRG